MDKYQMAYLVGIGLIGFAAVLRGLVGLWYDWKLKQRRKRIEDILHEPTEGDSTG